MSQVYVNGKRYDLPDGNISIVNDTVYLNGKPVGDEYLVNEKSAPTFKRSFRRHWHNMVDRLEDKFDSIIDWLDDLVDY